MPFLYSQSTGEMRYQPSGEAVIAHGYSGANDNTHGHNPHCVQGKNNPDAERLPCIGPVPRGTYSISSPVPSTMLGPMVFTLAPLPETNTYGRSGFCIHGDSVRHPGCASEGCIIAAYNERMALAHLMEEHHDNRLVVVAKFENM